MTSQPEERRAGGTRGADGKFTRDPATAERDAQAAKLRARGRSYRQIAAELEYSSVSNAYEAVQRALRAIVEEPAEDVRQLELARLDAMYDAAVKVLETEHVTVSQGHVVMLNDKPLTDDAPVLRAIETMLKIQARRAALLGLDAKTQHDMGIAEREIAIAEGQGELFAGVFFRILDALGLSEEQQVIAAEVMPQELRALEGGAA